MERFTGLSVGIFHLQYTLLQKVKIRERLREKIRSLRENLERERKGGGVCAFCRWGCEIGAVFEF